MPPVPKTPISEARVLRQEDFDHFAHLSGDHNPIHVNPAFAADTHFGATVSHGMLLFTVLRGLLERHYPGCHPDIQDLTFPAPAYADETLTLLLEHRTGPVDGSRYLTTRIRKADGRDCLQGYCRLPGPATARPELPPPGRPGTDRSDVPTAHPRFAVLRQADQARVSRVFSGEDVRRWCRLAGIDTTPDRVPEPLIAGLFSYLLGEELPGHGTNYLKQHLRFQEPARIDETLTATVAITRLRASMALINLDTICTGEDGRVVCAGNALVLFQC